MIRVLLVDDQALMRTGFRMILEGDPEVSVVAEAPDGERAVRLARECRPDVVLMDVRMPGMDGVTATKLITDSTDARVLILTTFDLDEYAYDGLRNGASGFLLKDVPPQRLSEAIRAVAAGEAVLTPRITRELVDRYARHSPGAESADDHALDRLTPRETEVLALIAQGLTNPEIVRRLYVSEATVKTHITRILAKLGLRDRVHAVIFAYEHGLR